MPPDADGLGKVLVVNIGRPLAPGNNGFDVAATAWPGTLFCVTAAGVLLNRLPENEEDALS